MLVQKGNIQYTIQDLDKEKYLNKGFVVVDERGKVIEKTSNIEKANIESIEMYKTKNKKLAKELEQAQLLIEKLKKENGSITKKHK